MNDGTILLSGMAIGVVAGLTVGTGAFLFAPLIQFPGQWAWLNNWGQIGVAFSAGWFAFVLSIVLSIFVTVAKGFNDMGTGL